MLNIPDSGEDGHSPDSSAGHTSSQLGLEGSHTELGIGVAVSRDYRANTTEQDLRGISRSASPVDVGHASNTHLPFENAASHGRHDDDAISVVSDMNEPRDHERDYDDMSSVSSFNDDDHSRVDVHRASFR